MSSDSPTAPPAPPVEHVETADSVILVPLPKIVFLWPTLVVALINGIYMSFNHAREAEGPVIAAVAFLVMLALNLVVLSFDFPRTTSLTVFFIIVALVMGGFLMMVYFPTILPWVSAQLFKIRPLANATFYYLFVFIMTLIYIGVAINTRFDYWEVRGNELLHHHGFLSDLERFPAPALKIDKEIKDVFEYLLLGSGRLILHPSNEPRAIVLENIAWITKKERAITRLLGTLNVRVRPDTPESNPWSLIPLSPAVPVELRSDTYTKPTPGMRQAIARAEVGDDMVGEDPTVNALEARMAELLGMEAAVFACSGTQSNQMAVWTHCTSGDELLIEETGHIANYESGAPAALSGVSVRRLRGDFGRLDVANVEGQIRCGNVHFAPTKLLCLENSTNLGGGRTYPLEQIERISDWAHSHGLKVHLDGARLFNACVARGYSAAAVAEHLDTVSICFSKGLGCPMGSVLVGSHDDIQRARRARKLFGGALRQAGIPAAACAYALDHNIDRLAEDHANAKLFAESIADIPGIHVDPATVETNLVFFDLDPAFGTAMQLSAALLKRDVRINPAGGIHRLRACTHLDVDRQGVLHAASAIRQCLASGLDQHSPQAAKTAYAAQ